MRRDTRLRHLGQLCMTAGLLALASVDSSLATDALRPPLGLPPLPEAPPADAMVVSLGKKLFFDRRLSFNGTMSCGMCHIEAEAFTSNQTATSIGMEGKSLRRKAPSLYNVAYETLLFRDGRETGLETQTWSPILSPDEMAAPSVGWVIRKIETLPDYAGLFEAAFGGRKASMETIGSAIAGYERTLLLADSRFDRWRYGGETDALSAEERAGYELFTGKAGCSACHRIGADSALFTDHEFHDTGIGYANTMGLRPRDFAVRLSAENSTRLTQADIRSINGKLPNDLGRFEVTLDPADRWAFKTPSLRNVALTGPYMHDGSFTTLAEVVDYYDAGGFDSPNKSDLVKPLHLDDGEKRALLAFLKALTGTRL
jgi:cytochrome c peroxidase